ncbi:MAG: YbbR-like domain-containing protein [Mariniphaga sp.]|nr:YbbR-like domain-containing protein [Mariniphaga sp.]
MVNQKISDIKGFFKLEKLRQDKRVVVFVVCVLISSALWFLNALDKDYETTITYPVRYINMPEKRFLANNPPSEFELKVSAHGFTLLRNKLNLTFTPIVLDVDRVITNAIEINSLTYTISGSRLANRISSQISNEISILEVHPESFVLILDSLQSKQVLVKPDIIIEFEPQYNITSRIIVMPEKVTVTGPGAILDTINIISTKSKKYTKVKKPLDQTLDLIIPDKINISPQKVQIQIPVEEFTEKKLTAQIGISNLPENTSIKLFPSEVQVSFMVGLSDYTKINANDFQFTIPYSEINAGNQDIQVQLDKKPEYIREIKFTPLTIEFLIEKE